MSNVNPKPDTLPKEIPGRTQSRGVTQRVKLLNAQTAELLLPREAGEEEITRGQPVLYIVKSLKGANKPSSLWQR